MITPGLGGQVIIIAFKNMWTVRYLSTLKTIQGKESPSMRAIKPSSSPLEKRRKYLESDETNHEW